MLGPFRNVLLIEDERVTQHVLRKILKDAGYHVEVASNGIEGQQSVLDRCPHFVVTDLHMPEVDGIEFCGWLRKQVLPRYVYVLMLTANPESDSVVRALSAGADDFIRKPIVPEELLVRLSSGRRVLQLEHRLRETARRDSLTNVLNRRALMEVLDQEWSRSDRYSTAMSCVMIDVDKFKTVNDTYGHLAGDACLRNVASALTDAARTSDHVGRYGGEEFCVVLPETDSEGANVFAERCRQQIEAMPTIFGRDTIRVTASFGVSSRMKGVDETKDLLSLADQALLQSKQEGRNRVTNLQSGLKSHVGMLSNRAAMSFLRG